MGTRSYKLKPDENYDIVNRKQNFSLICVKEEDFKNFYNYLYASVSVCLCDGAAKFWCAVALGVQKKATEPLELKLQGILSH